MTKQEKLKSCPFCGCLAWVYQSRTVFNREPGKPVGWRVECEGDCHGMTCWWHCEDDAVKYWNTRTPTAPVTQPMGDTSRSPYTKDSDNFGHDPLRHTTAPVSDTKSDVERFAEILPEQDKAFQEALQPAPDTVSISREAAEEASDAFKELLAEAERDKAIHRACFYSRWLGYFQGLSTPQGEDNE